MHSLLTVVMLLVWPQEGLAVGGATVLVWEGPEPLELAEVQLEYGGMLRFVVAVHDGGAAARAVLCDGGLVGVLGAWLEGRPLEDTKAALAEL